MNHIGSVIKKYRNKINMSRKKLANNICTEKYVYLIERGERTPSSSIIRQFGNRMGVDLFKYYEYLDCENPIEVCCKISYFNKYRRENDLVNLKKITEHAMNLTDFSSRPWSYEIELNKFCYMILYEEKFAESIPLLLCRIKEIENDIIDEVCTANFYILLSTCFNKIKDHKRARKAAICAYEIIKDKRNITKYIQAIISSKINILSIQYLFKEFDEMIKGGLELNQYQICTCSYERSHYTFFYLACSYYEKGINREGIMWFKKMLYASLIRYKPLDIYYFSTYDIFYKLLDDEEIPNNLVLQFKNQYDVNGTIVP